MDVVLYELGLCEVQLGHGVNVEGSGLFSKNVGYLRSCWPARLGASAHALARALIINALADEPKLKIIKRTTVCL